MLNEVEAVPVYPGPGVPVGDGAATVKVIDMLPVVRPTWVLVRVSTDPVSTMGDDAPTRVMVQVYVVIGQLCAGGSVFMPGVPDPVMVIGVPVNVLSEPGPNGPLVTVAIAVGFIAVPGVQLYAKLLSVG
jgi:hypothetical protein